MSTPHSEERKEYIRLTEADWVEIKYLYESGKGSKTDLATKFGITRQTIAKGLSDRGAVYASKVKDIEDAIIEAQKDATKKKIDDINTMKDKQRQRVEFVQSLVIKEITDQVQAKKPVSDAKNNINTLRSAMAVLVMGRSELYHIFDLNRDPDAAEEMPEFIVGEYTADEIAALNEVRLGPASVSLESIVEDSDIDSDDDVLSGIMDDDD